MLAPSVPQVLETLRSTGGSDSLGSFCVTIYILGFCVGPVVLGPLSDVYGRVLILRACMIMFTLASIACALSQTLEMLIGFRLLAGIFGSAPMTVGAAVVADMYAVGSRDRAMSVFSAGSMLGPTLGPVLGSIINGTVGWRWVFWTTAILVSI